MPPSEDSGPARSLAILAERIAAVPGALRQTLEAWRADVVRDLGGPARWVCTGAGGSEGPARSLASLLRGLDARAAFVPLSSFAIDAIADTSARLVVFSQAFSPNARFALAARNRFDKTLLVTADSPQQTVTREIESSGGIVLAHPPAQESGLLVRVLGPAAATAISMLLTAELAGTAKELARSLERTLEGLDEVRERARAALPPLLEEEPAAVALVTAGGYGELAHGLRWKLLEGLGIADPPVWDVLQVAHGPFQQFYESRILLCALELPEPAQAELFDRLERMLVPERQRLVRLCAKSTGRTAWFEHDAMLNELLLAWLRARPRDLIDWPGKGADASLYRFGPPG